MAVKVHVSYNEDWSETYEPAITIWLYGEPGQKTIQIRADVKPHADNCYLIFDEPRRADGLPSTIEFDELDKLKKDLQTGKNIPDYGPVFEADQKAYDETKPEEYIEFPFKAKNKTIRELIEAFLEASKL